jgi:carboxypeptidase Taq
VHWSHGSIGYFPTYTLGSALAAQISAAIADDVAPVDELVAEGRYEAIGDWLQEHVHRHGARYETGDLIEQATGRPLSAEPFLAHARDRFGRLWDT